MNSASIKCTTPYLFDTDDAHLLAGQLKALAHPVRLQILQHLGNREECCCNDFCACIPLAQSTISQHLKILNQAGIIGYESSGNCSRYSLNPDALELVVHALAQLQKSTSPMEKERTENG